MTRPTNSEFGIRNSGRSEIIPGSCAATAKGTKDTKANTGLCIFLGVLCILCGGPAGRGVLIATAATAQEGHPLVGTWYGDWGPSPQERHDVTVIMTWDGKTIGGTIDPGPDAVPFKTATLDSSTWTVHIEAERPAKASDKAKTGAAVRYVIDGKLANLGSYNRTLTGTWIAGAIKGDFKITRD